MTVEQANVLLFAVDIIVGILLAGVVIRRPRP